MTDTFSEVLFIFILILANGFFAMSEIALVSARKVRLQQRAEDGDRGAKNALDLTETPNRLLSTVQVGITLIGTFSGAVGGATLAEKLAVPLKTIPWLAPSADGVALTIVVILITYFSLVIGELIPKRLGMNNPEKIAGGVSGVMKVIAWLVTPIVRLLSGSTDLGLKLLGVKASEEPPVTEDEIKVLIEQGKQVGVFEESEQDMVEGVFRFGERTIDVLMTPRTEIEWVDLDKPVDEILEQVMKSHHSRFPAGQDNLDNVQGILVARDLLTSKLVDETPDPRSLLVPPLFVPDSLGASDVLELFKKTGHHVAMVIDEYGGLLGMVTLHDMVTSIVGEIPSAFDEAETQAVKREDGSWLIDGLLPVDELKDLLDINALPEEEKIGYQTVGGLVMSMLGSIPTAGQHFHLGDWRFEVMDMDGKRVDKVLASRK